MVHLGNGEGELKHRGILYLENTATGNMLDSDGDDNAVQARHVDCGTWQQFAVEKMLLNNFTAAVQREQTPFTANVSSSIGEKRKSAADVPAECCKRVRATSHLFC